jgi:predicted phosphohydrolase
MAVYAIGDLHLCFSRPEKDMTVFGPAWKNREKRVLKNVRKLNEDDVLVLLGDHSWGTDLENSRPDLEYIKNLPGRKVLLRGNHDRFWDAKKTDRLNREFAGDLFFLQNNFYPYEDYALVGTKGIAFENLCTYEQFEKLRDREEKRLLTSFEAAEKAGFRKFIMLLHFPPTSIGEEESCFTRIAEEHHAEQVIYAHCHGTERHDDSFKGMVRGVNYSLASGDYLKFKPIRGL